MNDLRSNRMVSAATFIFMAVTAMLLGLSVFLFASLSDSIDNLMTEAETPDFLQMHTGEIDEELYGDIIDKYGTFTGRFARAVDFGGFTSEQVVINFLVCDGDEDRTQREPFFGDGLNKIGVAFGIHNLYKTICVLVACTEFNNIKDPDDIMVFKDDDEDEDKKKLEQEKLEKEKLEQEKLEQERLEKERLEKEKLEQEKLERERLEKEKA